MGSDLFGSFAESTCAALVLGAGIGSVGGWNAMVFPLVVSAVGLFVCLICSFLATHIRTVKSESQVEEALKLQLISTTILMIPALYVAAILYLPSEFTLESTVGKRVLTLHPWEAWLCIVMGAVGGLIIGLVTEYYTSHSYAPVREVANSCKTGAATNMIYGIALGYKSAIIPVLVLSVVIYGSFALCDMYGVALAAIGFLSNLATGLTIDVYGPVCDNAGVSDCFRHGVCAVRFGYVSREILHSPCLFVFHCRASQRWLSWTPAFVKRPMRWMPPVTQLPLSERDLPLVLPPLCL
jgi:H+-translocating diphosphatase